MASFHGLFGNPVNFSRLYVFKPCDAHLLRVCAFHFQKTDVVSMESARRSEYVYRNYKILYVLLDFSANEFRHKTYKPQSLKL